MTKLSVTGLNKRFGNHWALRDVSLDVMQGEFITIVGPSGCGKSTLLRIVAGLEQADSGAVRLDGTPLETLAPKDRDIAMVFQSLALYPHKTVRQNIAIPLEMRRLTFWGRAPLAQLVSRRVAEQCRAVKAAVQQTAATVGLTDTLDRKPSELSGGQRQRVAIARAVIRGAALTLMDEPFSSLDRRLREQLGDEVGRLQRTLKITILFVTHDAAEAMRLSDRIAVMNEGRIIETGRPQALYDDPGHLAVASLLGPATCNVVQGQWVERSLTFAGLTLRTANANTGAPAVTVGFRPESMSLAAQRPGTAGIAARVESVNHAGSDVFVRLRSVAGDHVLTARCAPQLVGSLAPGDSVTAVIDEVRLLIFDSQGVRCRTSVMRREREVVS
jgi:multiple sugar transport system ATP-binding protein